VKQYVLVAGVDYEFKGVNFRLLADNRRKLLTESNLKKEDLRFTTVDFRAGTLVTDEVTYAGGVKKATQSQTSSFSPIGPSNYTTTTDSSGATHTRFKPGQWGTASILDVYRKVREVGSKEPGTLAELSFLSHGWMGGPILVNSEDDRQAILPVPSTGGAPPFVASIITGTSRDPDDHDPRARYDFVAPTMDVPSLLEFSNAFSSDAKIWLWGCAFPQVVHHTLWAMERAKGYKPSGLGDDDQLVLDAVTKDDVDYLDRFLAPLLGPFPSRSTITANFKYLKYAICAMNASSYAWRLSDAAKVPTYAAPLGTYADYDKTGKFPLMNVVPDFSAHFAFYKNYLGFSFDPEGRRYAVYTPGRACTQPAP
jgi:hypothetical protein